jgi:integrase
VTRYTEEVRADERAATELGINGVPFFVLDRRYGVSGAQSPDILLQALEQAWADSHPSLVLTPVGAGADDAACTERHLPATERAEVRVLALRATGYGRVGEPAPVHPHPFRHARVRQIVRHTKSLALAQKQAGWARLHTEYLTLSDDEAQQLMRGVPE